MKKTNKNIGTTQKMVESEKNLSKEVKGLRDALSKVLTKKQMSQIIFGVQPEKREPEKREIPFCVSHYQISVIIFVERAFEKLYHKNPFSFFSLTEFLSLIEYRQLVPYWLNNNQFKDVITKMVDLRKIEELGGKYRFKPVDFTKEHSFLKD